MVRLVRINSRSNRSGDNAGPKLLIRKCGASESTPISEAFNWNKAITIDYLRIDQHKISFSAHAATEPYYLGTVNSCGWGGYQCC